jgi:hypothetical protein
MRSNGPLESESAILALNYPPRNGPSGRPENGIQPHGSSFFDNRGRIDAVAHAIDSFECRGIPRECRGEGGAAAIGAAGGMRVKYKRAPDLAARRELCDQTRGRSCKLGTHPSQNE